MVLLAFENVSKSYGSTPALEHINFEIEAGKIIGLLGPNGSGKTTMIKLSNGLLQSNDGKVLINGLQPSSEAKKCILFTRYDLPK